MTKLHCFCWQLIFISGNFFVLLNFRTSKMLSIFTSSLFNQSSVIVTYMMCLESRHAIASNNEGNLYFCQSFSKPNLRVSLSCAFVVEGFHLTKEGRMEKGKKKRNGERMTDR
jgi:hypothetical protein